VQCETNSLEQEVVPLEDDVATKVDAEGNAVEKKLGHTTIVNASDAIASIEDILMHDDVLKLEDGNNLLDLMHVIDAEENAAAPHEIGVPIVHRHNKPKKAHVDQVQPLGTY
jgi:hypothetical protein